MIGEALALTAQDIAVGLVTWAAISAVVGAIYAAVRMIGQRRARRWREKVTAEIAASRPPRHGESVVQYEQRLREGRRAA